MRVCVCVKDFKKVYPNENNTESGHIQITYKFRLIIFFSNLFVSILYRLFQFKLYYDFFCTHTDLQFSTDDEEFEEVVGDFETAAAVLGQGEGLARSAQPVNYMPGNHCFFFKFLFDGTWERIVF